MKSTIIVLALCLIFPMWLYGVYCLNVSRLAFLGGNTKLGTYKLIQAYLNGILSWLGVAGIVISMVFDFSS